jgi:murein DD-endopeptidase MepM/ murein hydrolase activator NlpD
MMRKLITLLIIMILMNGTGIVHAQDNQPSGPVYIVQSGDNLTSIAAQFGITQDELIAANAITDPNLLAVGDQLIIPGLEGITGVLMTRKVAFGSTLNSLAVENSVDRKLLTKLNHITSPIELYTGVSLIIPEKDPEPSVKNKFLLSQGQSILEFSILTNQNPWDVAIQNQIEKPALIPNGQVLYTSGGENLDGRGLQTLPLGNVEISPLPMIQGKTIIFKVAAPEGTQLSGILTDHPLHFFPDGNGTFIALQGIHAMQEPGVYPLQISMTTQDGSQYSQEQMVIIQDGNYGKDPVLMVKDEFIDPATTQPELDWLLTQVAPASPEKLWTGTFYSPSPYSFQDCLNSRYGNRRSYNGGPFNNFHSGVDFCGGEGVKIYAAADGVVVFSGPLTVRGNATIIDHGWGVYSGYWHQTQSLVKTGDKIIGGQVIGLVGGTGRVTGAHLHWEVWVGGVQVNPLDWLTGNYP